MKLFVATLVGLAAVALCVPSTAAEEPAAEPSSPSTPIAAAKACAVPAALAAQPEGAPIRLFPDDPTQQTCTLQIECSDGSVISCMGNNTCSTSSNGRCTICDGVQTACCALTCCEQCDLNYDNCISGCDPQFPITCNVCDRVYNRCVSNCTGGCF